MDIFFGFQSLCAESEEIFLQKKMENSHPHCRIVQKNLLHSRKLRKVSSAAETGEMFLMRQKQRINPVCSVILQTLDSMFVHKLAVAEWDLGAHFAGVLGLTFFLEKVQTKHCLITSTPFLEKVQTKRCLITSRNMSKVQEV